MENKILTYDSVEISFDGEAVVHDCLLYTSDAADE